jgi:hypothetical protein
MAHSLDSERTVAKQAERQLAEVRGANATAGERMPLGSSP